MDNGDSGQPEMTPKKHSQYTMLVIEAFNRQQCHGSSVTPVTINIISYTLTHTEWPVRLQTLPTASLQKVP